MPKRKGETNQQWMQRLQDYRRDHLMEQTRAAVCFVNTGVSEASKLNAFLGVFHPEMEDDRRRELVNDARAREQRR